MKSNHNWTSNKLQEFASFEGGGTPSRKKTEYFEKGTIPWVKTLDLNNAIISRTEECITELGLKKSSCKILPKGSVLIAMYGGFNQIGRTGLLSMEATVNQAITAIILDRNKLLPRYLLFYLNFNVQKWKKFAVSSRKDPNITKEDIKKMLISFPSSIQEQQKIVEVLETWDKAIKLTRKLIEQKELQKKYLMQQLLTGRTRLKGFTGKWIPCKLKEICAIRKGEQLNATELKDQGEYPCLNGGIAPSGYTDNWNTEKNTISISEGGNSCGYVNWNPKRFWAGGHCYTLSDIKANPEFLYFLLKNKEKHIMNLRVGSGLPNIQRSSLENLSLSIPESKEEQSQIGRLLIGVDIGIEFAQKYLAKLEEQKKGLMQVLLTGKVRLKI